MKKTFAAIIAILCGIYSCRSAENTNTPKISFGIYETVNSAEIPEPIINKMMTTGIGFESDTTLPFIGYFRKTDTADFSVVSFADGIKIIRTSNTIDSGSIQYGLVAIRPDRVIQMEDIQKTKVNGKDVEIHFNLEGAKKWAAMIKKNIGNHVAIVINEQVYDLPYINGEIKIGIAMIRGLEDETAAKILSDSLNSGIR